MTELRCPNTMHGILDVDKDTIEVKCDNNRCGARSGVVVLHTFDLISGALLRTRRFRDPITKQGGETNGNPGVRTAVRSA
jgi:hypothetical protein